MQKYSLYLLLPALCIVGTCGWIYQSNLKNSLTFTNTQEWDNSLEVLRYEKPTIIGDTYKTISIAPPPANTSKGTAEDLKKLHEFSSLRTEETKVRIESEKKLANAYFGEKTYGEIVSTTTNPATSYFIQESLHELSFLIMHFKGYYNRVRPSYLDTSLSTTIEVPHHPSYPSGHATESYFVALMMSELDPQHKDTYIESAYRIANGREIAGVHYPTDSEAGRALATQYFERLKETGWYRANFELAEREWQTKN